ncbi:hypothetical protein HUG20_09095 [Salicibibacter cibi]|uniref:Uncharacterized protein n=1 Tax=Salicibibacter cibi TaxID=2743001 RepID=A0A7T7CFF5_9BACI|nr:hypothetical protein [Salicibibacter cibi]QQK80028.1 hypothetical protein HUG20_09095 [Salicibibacter cibi]
MGFFDFFKRDQKHQEQVSKDKYWVLTTSEDEIIDPVWEQVKGAIDHATPDRSMFASLGYMHSGIEIEVIQVVGEDHVYRFEALPPKSSDDYGKIFVNDGISYEETLKLCEDFYKHQRVVGFRNLPIEKKKF